MSDPTFWQKIAAEAAGWPDTFRGDLEPDTINWCVRGASADICRDFEYLALQMARALGVLVGADPTSAVLYRLRGRGRYVQSQPYKIETRSGAVVVISEGSRDSVVPLRDALIEYCHERAESNDPVEPDAVCVMRAAMNRLSLNPAILTAKVRTTLKAGGMKKPKADRTTMYRILQGKTKRPHPAIRNALVSALELTEKESEIVQRELGAWNQK